VELNWATANETNNAFFTIERSADAQQFETVGTREGSGNSNDVQRYSFMDLSPLKGTSYYRLKQTDFNGEFEYSEIIKVEIYEVQETISYRLYPNPVDKGGIVTLEFINNNSLTKPIQYEIISMNGNVFEKGQTTPQNGRMRIFLNDRTPAGVYMIRCGNTEIPPNSKRFVIR